MDRATRHEFPGAFITDAERCQQFPGVLAQMRRRKSAGRTAASGELGHLESQAVEVECPQLARVSGLWSLQYALEREYFGEAQPRCTQQRHDFLEGSAG